MTDQALKQTTLMNASRDPSQSAFARLKHLSRKASYVSKYSAHLDLLNKLIGTIVVSLPLRIVNVNLKTVSGVPPSRRERPQI